VLHFSRFHSREGRSTSKKGDREVEKPGKVIGIAGDVRTWERGTTQSGTRVVREILVRETNRRGRGHEEREKSKKEGPPAVRRTGKRSGASRRKIVARKLAGAVFSGFCSVKGKKGVKLSKDMGTEGTQKNQRTSLIRVRNTLESSEGI